MCTNGTAAQVIDGDGGKSDYTAIFGAGIALDFNNPGGDGGAAKGYQHMTPYVGIGFISPATRFRPGNAGQLPLQWSRPPGFRFGARF